MAEVLIKALKRGRLCNKEPGCSPQSLRRYIIRRLLRPEAKIIPTADLIRVMKKLKDRKCLIGLATADSERLRVLSGPLKDTELF